MYLDGLDGGLQLPRHLLREPRVLFCHLDERCFGRCVEVVALCKGLEAAKVVLRLKRG